MINGWQWILLITIEKDKAVNKNGRKINLGKLRSMKKIKEELVKGRFSCKNCHRKETQLEIKKLMKPDSELNTKQLYDRNKGIPLTYVVNEEKLRRAKCIDCNLLVDTNLENSMIFEFITKMQRRNCLPLH